MLTSHQIPAGNSLKTISGVELAKTENSQNELIAAAVEHYQLGSLVENPLKLSSGLTNQVYHLKTTSGEFVIKIVNKSSPRVRSLEDYRNIEQLQKYFSLTCQLPVILAKTVNLEAVYKCDNVFVLIYPYINAKSIGGPIGPVTTEQARNAGELLGKIHSGQANKFVDLKKVFDLKFEYLYTLDFNKLKDLMYHHPNMNDFLDIAFETQSAYDRSRLQLIYSHGDFQPHNILGNDDGLTIIDWELAGLINPGMELIIALITFSGLATEDHFNINAFQQFLAGYGSTGCQIQDNLDDAIGSALHKCWINWIAFNMETNNHAEVVNAYQSLKRMLAERDNLKHYISDYKLQSEFGERRANQL